MKSIDRIKEILANLEQDVEKLEVKKVKAAATRVRKGLAEIIKAAREGRKEAMEIKSQIK
jgi:uncharacterized protein YdeI (YjbR/CyaY-like superfamily)